MTKIWNKKCSFPNKSDFFENELLGTGLILAFNCNLKITFVNLAKVKFDKQTNSLNELKQANEIYATELARLKKIIFDRQEVNRAKVQEERKQQIGQLKSALAKIGKERETLKLENGKFTAQLDTLKNGQMDEKMKSKKELDTLRTELRRARVR